MNETSTAASDLLNRLIDAEQAYKAVLHDVQAHGAELFKTIREEYMMTQRQLADVLRVDFSFISKVENNHIRPGKPVLRRLAEFLAEVEPPPRGARGETEG